MQILQFLIFKVFLYQQKRLIYHNVQYVSVVGMSKFEKITEDIEFIAKVDKQGRILIPLDIRRMLDITGGDTYVKVKLVGMMKKED